MTCARRARGRERRGAGLALRCAALHRAEIGTLCCALLRLLISSPPLCYAVLRCAAQRSVRSVRQRPRCRWRCRPGRRCRTPRGARRRAGRCGPTARRVWGSLRLPRPRAGRASQRSGRGGRRIRAFGMGRACSSRDLWATLRPPSAAAPVPAHFWALPAASGSVWKSSADSSHLKPSRFIQFSTSSRRTAALLSCPADLSAALPAPPDRLPSLLGLSTKGVGRFDDFGAESGAGGPRFPMRLRDPREGDREAQDGDSSMLCDRYCS